jgi:hypothetical protein
MHTYCNVVATVDASSTKCGRNGKRGAHESVKNALEPVAAWRSTRAAKRDGMPVYLIGRTRNGRAFKRIAVTGATLQCPHRVDVAGRSRGATTGRSAVQQIMIVIRRDDAESYRISRLLEAQITEHIANGSVY